MTTVYGLYRTGKEAPKVEGFASVEIALNSGNGFILVKEQDCLSDVGRFPTGFLVDLYNLKAERKVSKFRDRATAESRVWKMLTDQEAPEDLPESETSAEETESKTRKRVDFNGCKFKATVDENTHRRKTSNGWPYFQIVLDNPEISYEDLKTQYESLGRGRVDPHIRHDIKRGKIEVLK